MAWLVKSSAADGKVLGSNPDQTIFWLGEKKKNKAFRVKSLINVKKDISYN